MIEGGVHMTKRQKYNEVIKLSVKGAGHKSI
jgi:hypothetical protein